MGKGTAEEMDRVGWKVDFIGSGEAQAVIQAFGEIAAGQRVGFVQARNSRQSVEQRLRDKVSVIPLVAYDNVPKAEINVRPADYLVFTSPLNFATYHEHYPITAASRYVAIGTSTAQAFVTAGIAHFRVATTPSQEGLAAAVLAWEVEEPRFA